MPIAAKFGAAALDFRNGSRRRLHPEEIEPSVTNDGRNLARGDLQTEFLPRRHPRRLCEGLVNESVIVARRRVGRDAEQMQQITWAPTLFWRIVVVRTGDLEARNLVETLKVFCVSIARIDVVDF